MRETPVFVVSWSGGRVVAVHSRRFYVGRSGVEGLPEEVRDRFLEAGCDSVTVCLFDDSFGEVVSLDVKGPLAKMVSRWHLMVEAHGDDGILLQDHGWGGRGSTHGTLVYGEGRWFYLRGKRVVVKHHAYVSIAGVVALHIYRVVAGDTLVLPIYNGAPTPLDERLQRVVDRIVVAKRVTRMGDTTILLRPEFSEVVGSVTESINVEGRVFKVEVHAKPGLDPSSNIWNAWALINDALTRVRGALLNVRKVCEGVGYPPMQAVRDCVSEVYKTVKCIVEALVPMIGDCILRAGAEVFQVVGKHLEETKKLLNDVERVYNVVSSGSLYNPGEVCRLITTILEKLDDTLELCREILKNRQLLSPQSGIPNP